MKYVLMIYGDEAAWAGLDDAAMKAVYDAHMAYAGEMEAAGVLRGGEELKPVATATTVRFEAGRAELLDGPFAETREQLGGFYLIEVDSLDEALAWARRMPGMDSGCVEVRPCS